MAVFPSLDFLQIKARYPKAVAKITEWIFNQPELQSVTADFIDPKNPEEAKEQFTGLLIQMDPRKLYDIFDSFGIHVNVQGPYDGGEWLGCLKGHKLEEAGDFISSNRHTAEVSAFHDAFETLEKQL